MSSIASQQMNIKKFISSAADVADDAALMVPHVDPMLDRISRAADAVEKMAKDTALASKDAKKVFTEVENGVHQFSGKTLPETEKLLVELNALLVSLRRLSEQTERNPSSLLRGRQPVLLGPGEKISP
jgi:phospholipid/cholesterol/gamma-HCH transport system substrate-binding protein